VDISDENNTDKPNLSEFEKLFEIKEAMLSHVVEQF